MNSMNISVVIPTFNRVVSLIETLSYLENQNYDKSFEVIVVDDWSTDFTQKRLKDFETKKFELKILKQENKKQWVARNFWASVAKGDLIIFLQDDIWASPDLLISHIKMHKYIWSKEINNLNAVIWKTVWTNKLRNNKFHKFLDWTWDSIFPWQLFDYVSLKNWKETDFSHFYTNNLSIKKSFFEQEKFNEKFNSYWWEDMELWFRLFKKGMKIYFAEKALVSHNHKYTFWSYLKREENVSKNLEKLIKLQPELAKVYKMSYIKKIIFSIFSQKIFLNLFKYFWKEAYWYFSAKKIWLSSVKNI